MIGDSTDKSDKLVEQIVWELSAMENEYYHVFRPKHKITNISIGIGLKC
jgi:hypothetical protein